jgi:hypothetical protein
MSAPLIILAGLATVTGFFVYDQVGEALGFAGGIGRSSTSTSRTSSRARLRAVRRHRHGDGARRHRHRLAYWHGDARAPPGAPWAPDLHALLVNRYYMDHLYQGIIDRVILGRAAWWPGSTSAWSTRPASTAARRPSDTSATA